MDRNDIEKLHSDLLAGWNRRDARQMSSLFTEDGSVVGFDGSQIHGRSAIESEMRRIFGDHQTASYVSKVREVRFLGAGVGLLRAVVGMVPPGEADINPAVNAIQSLVAVKQGTTWRIALYQNTPAQFHGRPELTAKLTEELRELVPHVSEPARSVRGADAPRRRSGREDDGSP